MYELEFEFGIEQGGVLLPTVTDEPTARPNNVAGSTKGIDVEQFGVPLYSSIAVEVDGVVRHLCVSGPEMTQGVANHLLPLLPVDMAREAALHRQRFTVAVTLASDPSLIGPKPPA